MTAPNVEELLQVNGYHGGTVRVRDRQEVADYVLELQQENSMLKGQLLRLILTVQAQQNKIRGTKRHA